jgi:hypothetical protein
MHFRGERQQRHVAVCKINRGTDLRKVHKASALRVHRPARGREGPYRPQHGGVGSQGHGVQLGVTPPCAVRFTQGAGGLGVVGGGAVLERPRGGAVEGRGGSEGVREEGARGDGSKGGRGQQRGQWRGVGPPRWTRGRRNSAGALNGGITDVDALSAGRQAIVVQRGKRHQLGAGRLR